MSASLHSHPIPTTGMRGGLGRTLLTAFLLLAIGPLSLVGYVAASQARGDRQRETVEQLTTAADLQEAQLREWIHARMQSLAMLANDPMMVNGLAHGDEQALQSASGHLKMVLQNDATFRDVFLVVGSDEERWISATTGQVEPRPAWAVSPHDVQVVPRFWLGATGEPACELAVAVYNPQETIHPLGFVVGYAQRASSSHTAAFGLGRTGTVYLINRERQPLALQATPPTNVRESLGVTRALRQGQRGDAAYENGAGIPVIGVYRWLDDLEWALIAEQDQAEAFTTSNELAAGLIGATLGVALLTAIIAAVVTRQITRPIVLLTEAALKMSGGDLTVRVHSARQDEIGILARVFNTMASDLYDLYARLEQKVTERTHELQEAKEQIQYHAWQLAISAEVGRITTSILDLDTLLGRASGLVRDAFQLEHVGVYLLDDSGQVAALAKNIGRGVPAHERQLRVGSAHPVSWVITQRMPRTLTQVSSDSRSETRHQLVLPLTLGTKTIGALDMSSRDPAGFSESDRSVLQTLADQLTVAIENARSYRQEREAINEMREIDRLRGQFLMRMSHQLATYLNSIIGFSQLMLKGLDGPLTELQSKDLAAIRHSGQQLSRLLDHILELANLEVGAVEIHYAPVDLAGLLAELQTTLASTLVNPQLRLDVLIGPGLPALKADADRLRQVLTNLVVTAAEMSHEGVITLCVARVGDAPQGLEEQVQFLVSAPAQWESAEENHGISLALSRRLVELHGGRLQVGQHAEGSTVFEFALPVKARLAPETEPD